MTNYPLPKMFDCIIVGAGPAGITAAYHLAGASHLCSPPLEIGARSQESGVRRKEEEGRRKEEEGRRKEEEGRRKEEEGRSHNKCFYKYEMLPT